MSRGACPGACLTLSLPERRPHRPPPTPTSPTGLLHRVAAAIAGAAVQTALLGRLAPSSSLAAYAAVTVSLRTATLLFFSFFVDAAAARLSHSLGRRDITTARSQAALNLTPCLVLGSATAAALLAGRQKLLGLLRLEPALLAETLPFWTLVAAAMPCTLANLAICVILQASAGTCSCCMMCCVHPHPALANHLESVHACMHHMLANACARPLWSIRRACGTWDWQLPLR